jgi:hypothetical protein
VSAGRDSLKVKTAIPSSTTKESEALIKSSTREPRSVMYLPLVVMSTTYRIGWPRRPADAAMLRSRIETTELVYRYVAFFRDDGLPL